MEVAPLADEIDISDERSLQLVLNFLVSDLLVIQSCTIKDLFFRRNTHQNRSIYGNF